MPCSTPQQGTSSKAKKTPRSRPHQALIHCRRNGASTSPFHQSHRAHLLQRSPPACIYCVSWVQWLLPCFIHASESVTRQQRIKESPLSNMTAAQQWSSAEVAVIAGGGVVGISPCRDLVVSQLRRSPAGLHIDLRCYRRLSALSPDEDEQVGTKRLTLRPRPNMS